ncbi:RagB/SusD family nutrient uptake outer membrane protein [Niastella caeni]|uniref:RagB/SusD family nutrient uptake outer membrane protein n=1 Tax=Niastella caeni TaxID=2569763 RepID=A0A4S8HYA7_9BACT|nr:RagB/SusD family nutrient uptake outer membrane protein [Niastella caeni]THU40301.1 RagB/SusD family nutrient uptake outer membrane protein [Niastella caeni]
MKKSIFLIAGAGLMMMASCKKQLEEQAFSFLTPSNFYKNAADAQTAINGVFSAMQTQTHYQRTVWLISELPADNLVGITTQERADLNQFKWTPANAEIYNWWRSSYLMINRANDVIKYVPGINMDVTNRNHIVGNARFLRALGYFDLVRNFGDVPLVLRPIETAGDSLLFPSRAPAAEVYKTIIEDLTFAEANCLAENKIPSGNKGMVSSGAAATLLGKVYLQRASTTFAEPQDNQNALAALNRVIASKVYQLLPKYQDVFDNAKKNGSEHIFSVQFGPVATGITSNIILRMLFPTQLGGAAAFFANNNFFQNGYSTADSIRKNWNMANKVGSTNVSPFVYKYRDPSYVSNSNNSNVNWIVLRYSDVLLMQSEAMNNINPSDPAKFAGVDSVRSRAGLKDPAQQLNFTNTATQEAFIDSLVKDRARELFIEGHRRYDLIRLKRYKQVMQALGTTVQDHQFLLPVPQTERDINRNLGQNLGYPQ